MQRDNGWHMGVGGWDLWNNNEVIASVGRTLVHWSGSYFGDNLPHKTFVGPPAHPRDTMLMIEEYITAPRR